MIAERGVEVSAYKVLITEDDPATRHFLRTVLAKSGYQVLEAASGEEALVVCQSEDPSLVVLDVGLPGMDGFEVCRVLRESGCRIGILMLTIKGDDLDKIQGLESGADDYMVKPFNYLELVARVRAVLRRVVPAEPLPEAFEHKGVRLEPQTRKVFRDGIEIRLTPREYHLLMELLGNCGKALSREELTASLWGINHYGSPKLLDVYVRRLREKIEADPSEPRVIQTVWGYGYMCG